MRSIILALVSAGSLTVAALTPAFATGACGSYPDLRNCPVYGVYDNPNSYQQSPYQFPSKCIRHARNINASYRHHG